MTNAQSVTITVADVAAALGTTEKSMLRSLALVGWNILMNDASRLAHQEHFGKIKQGPAGTATRHEGPNWRHVVQAAQQLVPDSMRSAPKPLGTRHQGFLYVLYDSSAGLCKIGRTKTTKGQRQRVQMSAHGGILANIVNAEVSNCIEAESQCHDYFSERRKNGEWFEVSPEEVVRYIQDFLNPMSIDFESIELLERLGILQAIAPKASLSASSLLA
ncbi:GIY-YIG nuclease family protein [Pseudoduganella plicata]|uniref:GIY-YIG nuclease family protein n=1 Tax=Pseudoduganella plicata TaxID=321984 RepID=A0ABX5SBU8_9BURK|nr:GIY-YIG nuclease family protein [Pseudoduganella plicata]QBQ36739.1 GIY-YIG nuclease family protein [Pseudoduganella plicata]